ncbi:MAG: S41 family peptidase [Alphaproteobacteria bacterium]|nr:S41 family peptidase [Alphaproteobacteria bacterium]MBV9554689.1 S41 family peptidase [Alphaproteobacteria bacterium]
MTERVRAPHRLLRLLSCAGALAAAVLVDGCRPVAADNSGGTSPADVAFIERTMQEVEKSYVEPVKPNDLVTGALKGMLTRLDPHSDYMDEREFRDLMATTSGQFGGVGIEISVDDGVPQIISAIEGTPAAAAGLNPGDRITKADSQALVGMDIEEVVRKLRGAPGTAVTLTIARSGKAPFDVKITRAIIRVDSVKFALEPNRVGYVRISTFDENTATQLRAAIAKLRQQAGGSFTGFVLDLRNDAGGLLDAAVEAAADFLDSGTVVTTRGRDPEENRVYEAAPNGDLVRNVPMVVLVNGASASAAEIVAGALQDNHRAFLMGTRSFGKGSVQSIIPIEGRGALRLTTALYYTPSGRSIQGQGVMPDQIVTLPKEQQVPNALVTYESDLYGSLKATGALAPSNASKPAAASGTGTTDHPIDPSVLGKAQDAQLAAALEYLKKHPRTASAQ